MQKKKILLLSSFGGYGHIAAADSLKKLFGSSYDIETVYPIKELRMYKLSSGEDFYNWLVSNNFNKLTNWIVRFLTRKLFMNRTKKTTSIIKNHIQEKKINILVSLIPFINFPASEAARLCNIPFLLVTTDNDLTNWVLDLEKMNISNFKVTYGYDLNTTKNLLASKGIAKNSMQKIGLPLRPDFSLHTNKRLLRNKYNIPNEKNVVLIMMGGAGSKITTRYVKTLLKSSLDLHILVCVGRNIRLAKKLKTFNSTSRNTIDILAFTKKIHELLALSDLLITKPGPGSINEASSLKIPILIDNTTLPLFWEQANIDLVLQNNIGACINQVKDAPNLVERFLFDEQTRERVFRAYENLEQNCFSENILQVVNEMLKTSASESPVELECKTTTHK